MNPSEQHSRILALIEQARPLLLAELDKVEHGEQAIDSLRSLLIIKERLEQIEADVLAGSIQPNDENKGLMGRFVVDTWPYDHILGLVILEIEHQYYRHRHRK